MNRAEARTLWQRIAKGDLQHAQDDPIDLHGFIEGVATALLQADDLIDVNARRSAVLTALNLSGKPDGYAELRRLIDSPVYSFEHLDTSSVTPGRVNRKIMNDARKIGILTGVYVVDDKKALNLIRKIKEGRG